MYKSIHPSSDSTILDLPLRKVLETCNKAMNFTPSLAEYPPPKFTIFCDGSGPKLIFHVNGDEKIVPLLKTDFGSDLADRLKAVTPS